ncbi:MAG TPA: PA domain-containing protein, partial [Solirubrobacteraceae bacterium]|nr:PA domain-containing protein [Solirubrobacteraceae bacterium]
MADAESVGAEFNDHYLRENEDDGTLTAQVLGDDTQIELLRAMGYEITGTIEDEEAYWDRIAERLQAMEAEQQAIEYAENGPPNFNMFGLRAGIAATAVTEEITINRVDYFENYAGRFLSIEAHNATTAQTGNGGVAGTGPTLVVTWDAGPGTDIASGGPRTIGPYVDTDPNPDTYLYHRTLIRLGAPGTNTPPRPDRIRITSSTGASAEAEVQDWIKTGLPPHADDFQIDFHDRYMDPTEIYERFEQLADEFGGAGGIVDLIDLPYKTNGYQRKAMAHMDPPGARMTVDSGSAAGTYTVAQATYGPATPAAGISGAYALVQGTVGAPSEGCGALVGFPAGSIALVDRGNCTFAEKTANAQAAGAVAVVVVNNVPGAPTAPGGTALPGTTIPTVMVGQADGNTVKAGLPASGTVFGAVAASNASRVVL